MTPFASVAMLEKLALLKIARCRAPALSSASSACLRAVTSLAPSETPIRVVVTFVRLVMVLPGNLYSFHLADRLHDFTITLRACLQQSLRADVACKVAQRLSEAE